MKRFTLTLLCALAISAPALAEQKLRVQVDQRGDFMMIGNTLGWDCAAGAPPPSVGTLPSDCGLTWLDTGIDLFWRADEPAPGQATASTTYTPAQARSTAVLDLPDQATVTHAFLYWGARNDRAADTTVTIERPGVFTQTLSAIASSTAPAFGFGTVYQAVADVTSLVRAQGDGAYRVSGVDVRDLTFSIEDIMYAGWGLVVFYQLDSEPPRNLALFDGLDAIDIGGQASVSLSGFLVPSAGFDAKLGVLVYEGDENLTGDSLLFGQGALTQANALSDAENPANNFFNGTRSLLGRPVSNVGDLPQPTGVQGTMAGIDLDVIDVSSKVSAGQSSVNLRATSAIDSYFLGAFITSISTFRPDFNGSQKTVRDVNGGGLLPGDELEYTITVTNNGNDTSANTMLRDVIPTGTTFVPGSINVVSGANTGAKTDVAGDDQGAYDAATRTVIVYLGAGATSTLGGAIPIEQSSAVTFRVNVDANARGVIANQGMIDASGEKGAPTTTTVTDGNAGSPGSPTTDIPVAGCTSNADCGGSTPTCDLTQVPPVCVQCNGDMQCPGAGSTCDAATKLCQCNGQPMSCQDTDKDGLSDPDEVNHGTDPSDSDSDDDGVPDGQEVTPFIDSDADLLINALDPDSDDDALFDGTEQGYDCAGPGTDASKGHCRADADRATKTDPTKRDSDGGGASDGSEDTNLNGKRDAGERDPNAAQDDTSVVDTDGDGLSDPLETTLHSDLRDRDSDDDGLLDGDERNPSDDTDGDERINVLDVDSDNDVLYDGTESGKDCRQPDTQPGHCVADADLGATTTSPVVADSDHGGARDGNEDNNLDGKIDAGERDPTVGHGADDPGIPDTDGDGLSDPTEGHIGSDPNDADSDDDGVSDGKEANPADDSDGDGKANVLDADSDDDGLGDGTETGSRCSDPATDRTKNLCVPDADMGKTTTSMIDPDTDHGGVPDGSEDTNHNGALDPGERDPNDPLDDNARDDDAGVADAGTPVTLDGGPFNDNTLAGGGCACTVQPSFASASGWALALAGLLYRRKRARTG